ncbi:hypothetical protein AVEN_128691-1 [Araneus ventricosus]|uniref:Uncharacterized protein n=1 Tax=Araneus ventricosus TaxID=182803 RepID=A0A4Y2C0Q0_ARAVE|nr:hypothetical protein AVEN_128691-1 [Araneus ventricosus]
MMRTTPELAPPSPNFHATPAGGRSATTYDLAGPLHGSLRWSRSRAWSPPAPKAGTLPLGHRGPHLYTIPQIDETDEMETKYELIETHTELSNGNSLKKCRAAQQNENEESKERNSLLTENDEQIPFMPTFKEKEKIWLLAC